MDVAALVRYMGVSMAALLVMCLVTSWVTGRSRSWAVFAIASLVGIFAYGVISGRLIGDHPGVELAPFFALLALGTLGLILGVIWTLGAGALRAILRRFRNA